MALVKPSSSVFALIGDVVGSRLARDRHALHEQVEAALGRTNARVDALAPLAVTAGDEFQGRYAALGAALQAAMTIRLELLPTVDVRIGIGHGAAEDLDQDRGLTDGPAWWAAREAIEAAQERARSAGTRHTRTVVRSARRDDHLDPVNAALECQDHLIGSCSQRSQRLLRGLMSGATQAELAAAEGISPSAVSQRVRSDGLAVIVSSAQLLAGLA